MPGAQPEDAFLQSQRAYWGALATQVSDEVAANHWVDEQGKPIGIAMFREVALFLRERFAQRPVRVLEVGCGNGLILRELQHILPPGSMTCGVDLSKEMLHRSVAPGMIACADARRVPFKQGSFDLVFLHSVVQYFDNESYLRNVIRETTRLTAAGGTVVFMDVLPSWYDDVGRTPTIRRRLVSLAERSAPRLVNALRGRRQTMQETIGGAAIKSPVFRGFRPDIDIFSEWSTEFDQITIEVQPFKSKPLMYRRFRFNVILSGRKSGGRTFEVASRGVMSEDIGKTM